MSSKKVKAAKKQKQPEKRQHPKNRAVNPKVAVKLNNPYRGKLYSTMYELGSNDYMDKAELLKAASQKTGKKLSSCEFCYQVLKSPKHRSNGNRSALLEQDGKVKFIDIRKPRTE